MDNPTHPEAAWLGIKLATLVAGFAGGVISLSFIKNLNTQQGLLAVGTGVASAAYGTPLAIQYAFSGVSSVPLENGIAFVIGLTAMNTIPGLIRLSEIFKRDPRSFLGGGDK